MKFSDEWSKIERKLKETIQKSARSLYEKKLFSLEQMNQFFISSNLEGVFFFDYCVIVVTTSLLAYNLFLLFHVFNFYSWRWNHFRALNPREYIFFKSFLKTSFKWSECSLCIHLCFLNVTLEENKQQHKWYK